MRCWYHTLQLGMTFNEHVCGVVFSFYKQDVDDDEEHGAGAASHEEWLSRAAAVARASPAVCFSMLSDRITAQQQALLSTPDPAGPLEQLCWLVSMSAHVLADSGAGETPLPPEAVLLALSDDSAGGEAVERLSRSLLQLCSLCLREDAAALCSARLTEACLSAAARWADTYLFSEEGPLPDRLEAAFGAASGGGLAVLDMLVQCANKCLVAYPGEAELHSEVRRVA